MESQTNTYKKNTHGQTAKGTDDYNIDRTGKEPWMNIRDRKERQTERCVRKIDRRIDNRMRMNINDTLIHFLSHPFTHTPYKDISLLFHSFSHPYTYPFSLTHSSIHRTIHTLSSTQSYLHLIHTHPGTHPLNQFP